jgi:hypothetical protein
LGLAIAKPEDKRLKRTSDFKAARGAFGAMRRSLRLTGRKVARFDG